MASITSRHRTNAEAVGGILTNTFLNLLYEKGSSYPFFAPPSFTFNDVEVTTESDLENQITESWEYLKPQWDRIRKDIHKADTTTIRNRWLLPVFQELGFQPQYLASNLKTTSGEQFNLSHRGWPEDGAPIIHLISPKDTKDEQLDEKTRSNQRSPHDELQSYLNQSEVDTWGVVSNGLNLRLLRDYYHSYSRAYIEFNIAIIFETRSFEDFSALYKLCHASRFIPDKDGKTPLEKAYEESHALGVQVGSRLQANVVRAIEHIGNGFLSINGKLRDEITGNEHQLQEFYGEVLYIVYRILFLLFAEQRGLMPDRNSIYAKEYSITKLRELVESNLSTERDEHTDIWEGLKVTFQMVHDGVEELNITSFDGMLFKDEQIPKLADKSCRNRELLKAIAELTLMQEKHLRQRISYIDLGVEELGAVYESLLEFTPKVLTAPKEINDVTRREGEFVLEQVGMKRKTTASYYTDVRLVKQLIETALKPVYDDRVNKAGKDTKAQEEAILDIKVCDPSCGSGNFLIQTVSFFGLELAKIRTQDDTPPEDDIQQARRDVTAHCIYGVDLNPLAVELCKVSLWIHSAAKGHKLSFLDHHIKCGNSLIGTTPELLKKGIPDEAFNAVTGDDNEIAKKARARNKKERELESDQGTQQSLISIATGKVADQAMGYIHKIEDLSTSDPEQARKEFFKLTDSIEYTSKKFVADLWTSAFFWPLNDDEKMIPTTGLFREVQQGSKPSDTEFIEKVNDIAENYKFFHWHLEFPDIFEERENTGFDCILNNPPWERIKLQEKEFFSGINKEIAEAKNASVRKKLIKALLQTNTLIRNKFYAAKIESELVAEYIRNSGMHPLTSVGDINYYPLFVEKVSKLISSAGKAGIICPPGIASDSSMQSFFQYLMKHGLIESLLAFVNEKFIFPGVLHNFRFCALTLNGSSLFSDRTKFIYDCQTFDELEKESRYFYLSYNDLSLYNPNTKTAPVFYRHKDYLITKEIYTNLPILVNEDEKENAWNVNFHRMFDMTNDSNLFKRSNEKDRLPLYEAKMMHLYDHRFASFPQGEERPHMLPQTDEENYKDVTYEVDPYYWIDEKEVDRSLNNRWNRNWFIGYRGIALRTSERTMTFSVLPKCGVGNSINLIIPDISSVVRIVCLISCLNSIPFDYVARQKLSGPNLNQFIVKQLPILLPESYTEELIQIIVPIIMELIYTSNSLKNFAQDLWDELEHSTKRLLVEKYQNLNSSLGINKVGDPFVYDTTRRMDLMARLDAIHSILFRLDYEELEYVLTRFPLVQRKEEQLYGEYITSKLIKKYYKEYQGKI